MLRVIDLEAHFYTSEYIKELSRSPSYPLFRKKDGDEFLLFFDQELTLPYKTKLLEKLVDIEKRMGEMDEAGIDVQVLSLSVPGCEPLDPKLGAELSRKVNDELSKFVERHSDRFMGLACLAPQEPSSAVEEFERAIKDLGLKGLKLHSNINGVYPDDPRYHFIFERAERLKVPIYLHPTQNPITMLRGYGYGLAGPAFGYTFDAALSAMRIILSGLLDRYDVKIVLGHLGEALPFILKRMDFAYRHEWCSREGLPRLSKKPSEYLKTHFYFNTAGNFHEPALRCVYESFGSQRIVFASDYPYEDMKESIAFIQESFMKEGEKERVFHKNAEEFLGLR